MKLTRRWVPIILSVAILVNGIDNVITGSLGLLKVSGIDIFTSFSNYTALADTVKLQQGSNVLSVLLGILLIFLGSGLLRRRYNAWFWAVIILLLTFANSLLPTLSLHVTILSGIFLLLMLIYRKHFYIRKLNPMHYQKVIAWVSVVFAVGYGTIGSYLMRDQFHGVNSWVDALFFTFVTYSTVGYGDIIPITDNARLFTITMIVIGLGSFLAAFSVILGPIIQQNIRGVYKMVSNLNRLDNHIILCGDNVLTREIFNNLKAAGEQCYFMEPNNNRADKLEEQGIDVMHRNPMDDNDLANINLHKAHCFIVAYDDDARNILITMAAKHICDDKNSKKTKIITRIEHPNNIIKAKHAGADQVISPLKVSADYVVDRLFK